MGHSGVYAEPGIVVIGHSDLYGPGSAKDSGDDLTRRGLVRGIHTHHGDEMHLDCVIVHCNRGSPLCHQLLNFLHGLGA